MDGDFQRWRRKAEPSAAKLDIDLPRHLAAGSIARRELQRCFGRRLDETAMIDVRLAANELVTNAVVHGVGEIRLLAQAMPDHVRVEVSDQGEGFTVPAEVERGRGLAIVDDVSARWGVFPGSTHVWCHIASGAPGRPPG